MSRTSITKTSIALTLSLWGCAGSAANQHSDGLDAGTGAIVGRVVVTSQSTPLTQRCQVRLASSSAEVSDVSLAADGWVFTTMPRGPAKLDAILCGQLFFQLEPTLFVVPGQGEVGYFGHVALEFESVRPRPGEAAWQTVAVLGGLVGGLIAAAVAAGAKPITPTFFTKVEHHLDYAAREYALRYGTNSDWQVVDAVRYRLRSKRDAFVARHPDALQAEANLDGLKLVWLGVPRREPGKVAVRFEHYVKKAQLEGCRELTLTVDGKPTSYPVEQHVDEHPIALEEAVQGQLEFTTLQTLATARDVQFELCGLTRTLDAPARIATQDFAQRFQRDMQRR